MIRDVPITPEHGSKQKSCCLLNISSWSSDSVYLTSVLRHQILSHHHHQSHRLSSLDTYHQSRYGNEHHGVSVRASAIVHDIRCFGYRNLTLEPVYVASRYFQ